MNLDDLDLNAMLAPAWAAVRDRHPELPSITFAFSIDPVSPGDRAYAKVSPRAELRTARAWVDFSSGSPVITFTPYGLRGSTEDVVTTLLHETAHVLDWLRPGHRGGHGRRFADAAVELGLNVWLSVRARNEWWRLYLYPSERATASCLWSPVRRYETEWSDDLRPVYATVLDDLTTVLIPWKSAIVAATPGHCPIPKDAL